MCLVVKKFWKCKDTCHIQFTNYLLLVSNKWLYSKRWKCHKLSWHWGNVISGCHARLLHFEYNTNSNISWCEDVFFAPSGILYEGWLCVGIQRNIGSVPAMSWHRKAGTQPISSCKPTNPPLWDRPPCVQFCVIIWTKVLITQKKKCCMEAFFRVLYIYLLYGFFFFFFVFARKLPC